MLWLISLGQPQSLLGQRFDYINYGLNQGLSQAHCTTLLPDQRGYLWAGTRGGGLSQFDGQTFTNFTQADGLASNSIRCLAQDQLRRLWIATPRKLQRWSAQGFEDIRLPAGTAPIDNLLAINDTLLLAGTAKGCLRINTSNKRGKRFPEGNSLRYAKINCLVKANNASSWIGTTQGIFSFDANGNIQQFSRKDGLQSNHVVSIIPQSAGALLIIYAEHPPAYFYPQQKKAKPVTAKNLPLNIEQGVENGNGLWLLSKQSGIHFLTKGDSSWQQLNSFPTTPNLINELSIDLLGQVWVSTADQGLYKIIKLNFNNYLINDALPRGAVAALATNSNSQLWVGNKKGDLLFQRENKFIKYNRHSGYLNTPINSLAFEENDRLWVGTNGKGIALLDSLGLYKIFTEDQGLPSNNIQQIFFESPTKIWIAAPQASLAYLDITTVDSNEYFSIQPAVSPALRSINDLAIDPEGRLWAASERGLLYEVDSLGDAITLLNRQHGLPEESILKINFSNYPQAWISIAGQGVWQADFSAKPIRFEAASFNNRLRSKSIKAMSRDNQGNWWLGHDKGLDKVLKNEEVQFFGLNQGVNIGAFTGASISSAATASGHIWLGGSNGLINIDPAGTQRKGQAPLLSFESIELFYEPLANSKYSAFVNPDQTIKADLVLPWKENHFGFKFKGTQLNYPKEVKYQWRLAPLEKEWSPLSNLGNASYANLQPGQYQFIARSTIDGQHFSDTLNANFKIKTPFWKTGIFIISSILIGIFLLWFFIANYIRGVKAKSSERAERLALENNLLTLNQKALQLQMNPHYIFNTLNSINSLVAKGNNREARIQINTFAKQLRSTLSNSRSEAISLEKEVESLDQYLRMLQFSHPTPFDFSIKVDEDLDAEEIELPPMLIQPFVENAVLHGFNQLDKKGHIEIHFSRIGQLLRCAVRDNGIGRKAAGLHKKSDHQSHALDVTRERLDTLKGTLNYQSLKIVDLEEEQKAIGTEVIVQLPYSVNY